MDSNANDKHAWQSDSETVDGSNELDRVISIENKIMQHVDRIDEEMNQIGELLYEMKTGNEMKGEEEFIDFRVWIYDLARKIKFEERLLWDLMSRATKR